MSIREGDIINHKVKGRLMVADPRHDGDRVLLVGAERAYSYKVLPEYKEHSPLLFTDNECICPSCKASTITLEETYPLVRMLGKFPDSCD